jgi:hypothetical protein
MTKLKSRSRLRRPPQHQARQVLLQQQRQLKENTRELREAVASRLRFLPLLILAGLFYAGLFLLLTKVRPSQVKSWLLPNSYLPFHALLLPANFFFFTFLTLSKRWGVLISLMIQWLLFLKLQNFVLDLWAFGSAVFIGVSGYWLRVWWKNRQA